MRRGERKRRLTGFTVPVVGAGLQWDFSDTSRGVARRILGFLDDRRVLFNPYWQEESDHCVASAIDARRKLTEELERLPVGDGLAPHLEAMRAAFRHFADEVSSAQRRPDVFFREIDHTEAGLLVALGQLRATIGVQVGLICETLDLDVPANLEQLLPSPPS